MQRILALFFGTLLFSSCHEHQPLEIISERSPYGDFYMIVDSLSIPISENQHFIYPQFSTVVKDDSLFMLGYNQFRHSIDVFNLTGETYTNTINLEREGPNGIPEVISFTASSLDSIYIVSSFQISLMSSSGVIKDKTMINVPNSAIKGHNSEEAFFWVEKNEPVHYNEKRNTIYGHYHSMKYEMCDKRRYQNPKMVSGIDLGENRMRRIPAAFPYDKRNDCYGFANSLFTTWDGDSLIYNFKHDSNIYIYDLNRNETSAFDGRSLFTKNEASPLGCDRCQDMNHNLDHSLKSVSFERIIRDPYRKLYYRFHRKELPTDGNAQDYIFSDKDLFISVFDNGMAKTGEMILDNRPYPSHVAFPGEEGLYVSAPSGENTLNFHIFKIFLTKGTRNQYEFTSD